jgi:DNA excision repair protein ERCC-4
MKVNTYFMLYANSAEEQRYLSYIRRERESFERLIKERAVGRHRVYMQTISLT